MSSVRKPFRYNTIRSSFYKRIHKKMEGIQNVKLGLYKSI